MNNNILVIGDLMLDKYLYGKTERISPEAPVPVIRIKEEKYQLGGALNVVANLNRLGANAIPIGVIGDDHYGEKCESICKLQSICTDGLLYTNRRTTLKARVMSQGQHIVRVDKEEAIPIDNILEIDLLAKFDNLIEQYYPNCLVISDYNKGVLTYSVIKHIRRIAMKYDIKIFIDPKFDNFNLYRNAYVLKPNYREALQFVCRHNLLPDNKKNISTLPLKTIAELIINKLHPEYLIITMGKRGIAVYNGLGAAEMGTIESSKRHVYDVTGAGDVVLSVLTYYDNWGYDILESTKIASIAGSYVISDIGTSLLTNDIIRKLQP